MAKKKRRGHKKKPVRKDVRLAPRKRRESNPSKQSRADEPRQKGTNTVDDSPTDVRGRGDSGMILTDEHRLRSDLRLVSQAVNKGWNVQRKPMIRRRLEGILMKTVADVVTKEGVIPLESAADKMAIDAAKVLVAMDAQDIQRLKKEQKTDGLPVPPPSPTPTVNVNVQDNRTTVSIDPGVARIARLAERLGAREIDVDGRRVPVAELLGTVDEVSDTEDEG